MLLPRQWLTRADWLRPMVTVLWLPEGASMALWRAGPDRGLRCLGTAWISAGAEAAACYRKALRTLTEHCPRRGLRTRWSLPAAAFPGCLEAGSREEGLTVSLPDWIEMCWRALPGKEVPGQAGDALAGLHEKLTGWDSYSQPGTGFVIPLGGRFYFLGYAEECGFGRVSRRMERASAGQVPETDWLRQTRLLYRNRTGYSLERVLVPAEGRDCGEESGEVRLIHAAYPPGWEVPTEADLEGPEFLFHTAMAEGLDRPVPCRTGILRRKHQEEGWLWHMRAAAGLVLFAFLTGAVGACHHSPGDVNNASLQLEKWESARRNWKEQDLRWARNVAAEKEKDLPFRLVGMVAGSLPGDIHLDRIHVERQGKGESGPVLLDLEGWLEDREPGPEFKKWMASLRDDTSIREVQNLKFSSEGGILRFSLRGLAGGRSE